MLLPLIAWAITGVFFFIKPGYSEAYEQLAIKTYPSINSFTTPNTNQWSEIKIIHSILGEHLLVKNEDNKWSHLDRATMQTIEIPSEQQVEALIQDAIKHNTERYGNVVSLDGLTVLTSTQIEITLNWPQMSLYQQGPDTEFIDTMYQIHYLKWTGIKAVDNVLGVVGLALVIILALLGTILSFKRYSSVNKQ